MVLRAMVRPPPAARGTRRGLLVLAGGGVGGLVNHTLPREPRPAGRGYLGKCGDPRGCWAVGLLAAHPGSGHDVLQFVNNVNRIHQPYGNAMIVSFDMMLIMLRGAPLRGMPA